MKTCEAYQGPDPGNQCLDSPVAKDADGNMYCGKHAKISDALGVPCVPLPVPSCEMNKECGHAPTRMDGEGFLYCEHHGRIRKTHQKCRKLRAHELSNLAKGIRPKKY